jgi:deazaflavin-dependent oxidoreductase (nitroreductase family)
VPQGIGALPFCYLTTTGRITGNPHRIEIWFALDGDIAYLMAGDREGSDWVRNLMITPDVVLELGDQRRVTKARVVDPGSDQDALARRLLLEKYQREPGDDLGEWGRSALPVAVAWPAR